MGGDPSNLASGRYHTVQILVKRWNETAVTASLPEVDIHDWPTVAYRGHDDRHSVMALCNKTKRSGNSIFSREGEEVLHLQRSWNGYPLLHPEGRFSQGANPANQHHPQSGWPEADALRYLHRAGKSAYGDSW